VVTSIDDTFEEQSRGSSALALEHKGHRREIANAQDLHFAMKAHVFGVRNSSALALGRQT
jgi:hypothetical protein